MDQTLPADSTQTDVENLVAGLNQQDDVDGILVQLPLPEGMDEFSVVSAIDPSKDADGLHPCNLGNLVLDRAGVAPATPRGILTMLDHYDIPTWEALVVVVRRSSLVGRPLAIMLGLKGRDATVVLGHSRTRDLAALTSEADILVAAVGRPLMFGPEHVKPGVTVIDVGINCTDGGVVGDVDFGAVCEIAGAITPVPGGVGGRWPSPACWRTPWRPPNGAWGPFPDGEDRDAAIIHLRPRLRSQSWQARSRWDRTAFRFRTTR